MGNYIDFLTDEDSGDLSIVDGDFTLTSTTAQSLRQRIEARFSTWKGEWEYNTAFGTPYRQQLLIAGTTKAQADAVFVAQVNLEEDVTSIQNITSTFNPTTRSYELTRIEAYVDNALLDLTLATPSLTEFSYPMPRNLRDGFTVCGGMSQYADSANTLYELLNLDLQRFGISTWYNLWA